jgi:hypothetical protein
VHAEPPGEQTEPHKWAWHGGLGNCIPSSSNCSVLQLQPTACATWDAGVTTSLYREEQKLSNSQHSSQHSPRSPKTRSGFHPPLHILQSLGHTVSSNMHINIRKSDSLLVSRNHQLWSAHLSKYPGVSSALITSRSIELKREKTSNPKAIIATQGYLQKIKQERMKSIWHSRVSCRAKGCSLLPHLKPFLFFKILYYL